MEYKAENEKVYTTNADYTSVPNRSSFMHDPQIIRIRKILIIILGVCLSLAVISLISGLFDSQVVVEGMKERKGTQTGHAIISILFYGFGIFAVYRYSTLALRIFGVLVIIEAIGLGILLGLVIILGLIGLFASTSIPEDQYKPLIVGLSVFMIVFGILLVALFVFTIIIAKLTFRLVRLIEMKKSVIIQQI